jgi:hypothetical protein
MALFRQRQPRSNGGVEALFQVFGGGILTERDSFGRCKPDKSPTGRIGGEWRLVPGSVFGTYWVWMPNIYRPEVFVATPVSENE